MNAPQIIPKYIHRIWLGSKPLPESAFTFLKKQTIICSGYEHQLWTQEKASALFPFMLEGSAVMLQDERLSPVVKSDILRYEVLRLFGGIYLDTDVEILRNFDELLDGSFFCADEGMDNIGTAVLGSVQNHPMNYAMSAAIFENYNRDGVLKNPNAQMAFGGPWLFTKIAKRFNLEVLPRQVLYPFHNPKLPATIHFFNGAGSEYGWTKTISRGKSDSSHSPSNMAGARPNAGTPRIFYGRNK